MTFPEAIKQLILGYPKLGVAIRENRLGGIRLEPYCVGGFGMVDAIVQANGNILTKNETELTIIAADILAEDWHIVWGTQVI